MILFYSIKVIKKITKQIFLIFFFIYFYRVIFTYDLLKAQNKVYRPLCLSSGAFLYPAPYTPRKRLRPKFQALQFPDNLKLFKTPSQSYRTTPILEENPKTISLPQKGHPSKFTPSKCERKSNPQQYIIRQIQNNPKISLL